MKLFFCHRCLTSPQTTFLTRVLTNCGLQLANMINLCLKTLEAPTRSLVTNFLFGTPKDKLVQLLLDPSPLPEVISCAQCYGDQVFNDISTSDELGAFLCIEKERNDLDYGILNRQVLVF